MAFERFKKFNIDELIAQNPVEPRDASRMMVLNRAAQTAEHKHFYDLPQYLRAGDTIVINNSKVFPAKIFAKKSTGGKIEILLVRQMEDKYSWAALLREYKPGMRLFFEDGLSAEITGNTPQGEAVIKFNAQDILPYARKHGQMPLPPYIEKARAHCGLPKAIETDKEKYQTVYAREEGSIAAPTAGFHLTRDLLDKIKAMGVNIVYITLHVGWGTFKPLRGEPQNHQMLAELAEITPEAAAVINSTRKNCGRVIAVGTTSTRTLESFAGADGHITAGQKWTDLFIHDNYKFKIIDALITNFHFPDSTPLCLACAFAGGDFIYQAYAQAVAHKYRFYSFGDAMLIL